MENTTNNEVAVKNNDDLSIREMPLNAQLIALLKSKAENSELAGILSSTEKDIVGNEEIFQNDILVPKLWLMQASSELVKQEKRKQGQFINSLTEEVIGEKGEVLRFIVLRSFKRWQTFKLKHEGHKVKKEWVSSEVFVLGKNENLPYEETINGETYVRRQVISCYVLLEQDAIKGINRPFVVDFAATSKKGGRVIVSDISTIESAGLMCYCVFFEMYSKNETFTDGDAFVKNVKLGGSITEKAWPFLNDCRKSIITLSNQIEIDERDIIQDGDKDRMDDTSNVAEKVNTNQTNTRI